MGIPKFFRWLTRRYPLILKNISREEDCPPIGKSKCDIKVSISMRFLLTYICVN